MKIAIAVLCILVGTLAYFAAVAPPSAHNEIGSWFRVREPVPVPIAPEGTGIDMKAIAAAVDKPMFIAGKEVVMTKRDQAVMSHAMARQASGMHE